MPGSDLIVFCCLTALVWFWWSATHSRENAVELARSACRRCGVQLLDETVSLSRLRLRRNGSGHMGIARWYRFEFSTNGNDRRDGLVGIHGKKLLDMHLDLDIEELQQ